MVPVLKLMPRAELARLANVTQRFVQQLALLKWPALAIGVPGESGSPGAAAATVHCAEYRRVRVVLPVFHGQAIAQAAGRTRLRLGRNGLP